MTEDYCELMDMPASMCAHCRGQNKTVQEQASAEDAALTMRLLEDPSGVWFPADYPGTCSACHTPFPAGTAIRRNPNTNRTTWLAQCCA